MPTENETTQTAEAQTSEAATAEAAILTADDVKTLLTDALGSLKADILSEVDTRNQGLAANLSRKISSLSSTKKAAAKATVEEPKAEKPTEPKAATSPRSDEPVEAPSSSLKVSALETQLNDLQAQLAAERAEAHRLNSQAALTTAIQSSGAIKPTILQELLSSRFSGKLKRDGSDGSFYVEEADRTVSLQDAVNAYLKTQDGQFFQSPSGGVGGGSTEARPSVSSVSPPDKPKQRSLKGMLEQIGSGEAAFKSK